MAVDHVKSSVAVPHRLGLPAVVVRMADARGRTSSFVWAAALGVDQERGSRLRDHFARLAAAASLQL